MFGLPTWLWLGIATIVVYRVSLFAMSRGFRRIIRNEFISFCEELDPDLKITRQSSSRLWIGTDPEGSRVFDLEPLYKDVSSLQDQRTEARHRIYWEHLKNLHALRSTGRPLMDIEVHGPRIRPRIVGQAFFNSLSSERVVPRTPLGTTGLLTVYVLDGKQRMILITDEIAELLELHTEGLHHLAVENLAERFPAEAVRNVVEGDSGTVLQIRDGYDPARILVVPRHLQAGEAIAVVLPDPNSLILAPVPKDGDWSKLEVASRTPLGPGQPLIQRPVRVTLETIELA